MNRPAKLFLMCALLVAGTALCLRGQETKAVVEADGQALFSLHAGVGSISPAERAAIVNQRLQAILEGRPAAVQTKLEYSGTGIVIRVNGVSVISVTDADAQAEGQPGTVLAQQWSAAIEQALRRGVESRSRSDLVWRLAITTGLVILAFLLFFVLGRARRELASILKMRREKVPAFRIRSVELISADKVHRGLWTAMRVVHAFFFFVIFLGALLGIFGQFPATRHVALAVLNWVVTPLSDIGRGILRNLPNLFYIAVILVVTRVLLRAITFLFYQADRGVLSLEPWIHRDVARPTGQIIKAIVVIVALFFIAPLIPGTGSTAAKGISVILGLMVSFGSTSTVGNVIAGIVLTYMRPFQIGDRVNVGQVTGDVVERTFLYTRLRTIKNEDVLVPSLQALSSAIMNYSTLARTPGLILHTSVTIGYDAPWRTVHKLLLDAAASTSHILQEPKPFVLQTALSDFYVSYQINAYTDHPSEMAQIYSQLHQAIQDKFNEAGVEIMSPHYSSLRDGNTIAIPSSYVSKEYVPRAFRVVESGKAGGSLKQSPQGA
jgi:small-conductance mechanosensitive channel